jgi:hypothetical protein
LSIRLLLGGGFVLSWRLAMTTEFFSLPNDKPSPSTFDFPASDYSGWSLTEIPTHYLTQALGTLTDPYWRGYYDRLAKAVRRELGRRTAQ